MQLSFVLLSQSVGPDAAGVVSSYERLFPSEPRLLIEEGEAGLDISDAGGRWKILAVMAPLPVPDGEAQTATEFSLGSYIEGAAETDNHVAHWVVTTAGDTPSSLDELKAFTRVVAALATAEEATAIYDGMAGATHRADYFIDAATSLELPMPLWTGISIAGEEQDRLSILTLGLNRFELPEILVSTHADDGSEAVEFLMDLSLYCVQRGEAPAEGETVGGSDEQRVPVHYVPSPIDETEDVLEIRFS